MHRTYARDMGGFAFISPEKSPRRHHDLYYIYIITSIFYQQTLGISFNTRFKAPATYRSRAAIRTPYSVLLHGPDPVAARVQRTLRANGSTSETSTRGDFLTLFQYYSHGERTDRATRPFLDYSLSGRRSYCTGAQSLMSEEAPRTPHGSRNPWFQYRERSGRRLFLHSPGLVKRGLGAISNPWFLGAKWAHPPPGSRSRQGSNVLENRSTKLLQESLPREPIYFEGSVGVGESVLAHARTSLRHARDRELQRSTKNGLRMVNFIRLHRFLRTVP